MRLSAEQIDRFAALFDGNERSHGVWNPKTGKMHTEPRPATVKEYESHLNGKLGLGVVPIHDDNRCYFGIIDIDNHGSDHDLPLQEVVNIAEAARLPLSLCRSKSGGIHGYVFLMDPVPSALVRRKLEEWAKKLGYPKAEIFPKQNALLSDPSGVRQLGNWINLPYFKASETERYCWSNGRKLSFDEFLDHAEGLLVTEADLVGATPDHPEAPPCIQRILADGCGDGSRNEALYNVTVYLKKAHPDDYRDRAFDINSKVFDPPLPMVEARRTVNSAGRREYKYKCDEEPIKSLCDRPKCLQRKYGVGSEEANPNGTNHSALPVFSDLIKYLTEPIRWSVKMDGVTVDNLETDDILRYSRMEKIIVERLGRGAPMLKEKDWRAIVNALLESHRVVEVADDASTTGIIRAKLVDFAKKAAISMGRGELEEDDRSVLLRGLPIVYKSQDHVEYIAFRGSDFVDYLKRIRSEELKGVNMFFAIKSMGLTNMNIRVNDQVVKCWCIPMNEEWKSVIRPISFHKEF